MSSTITVPEELRRRVKRLASLLDIPQHKVLEMLLDLFEQDLLEEDRSVDREVVEELEKAEAEVEAVDPDWAERSRKIERAIRRGLTPELFRGNWGIELADEYHA